MEFSDFVRRQFRASLLFLFLGLGLGFLYSLQLIGVIPATWGSLSMGQLRSAHISLMLYGFIPLLLAFLPFSLCARDGVSLRSSLPLLRAFFLVWHTFLSIMTATLLLGLRRNLTFYDYVYELNFLLVFAGIFYIWALFRAGREYERRPLWLTIVQWVALAGPAALLLLMHPTLGRVEATRDGPHGDYTLGMSLALIPVYYLAIKQVAQRDFAQRGRIFWMLPLAGFLVSAVWRLTKLPFPYAAEWAFQSLTLCYLPLLFFWMKEAGAGFGRAPFLSLSALTFLAIDIEGNLLIIPAVRALFHRNDLVIGHAHLAVGLALFFLALSIVSPHLPRLRAHRFALAWSICLGLMALALTLAGFREAGLLDISIHTMWILRSLSGLLAMLTAAVFLFPSLTIRTEE